MDLVDLNGMWPSLKDIGKGIKSIVSSVEEKASDVTQSAVEGIKETVTNVADAASDFYEEHKETIDTVVKVVGTAAAVAAIGVVAAGVATAGVTQAAVGKGGSLLGNVAGLEAGTLASGIWNGFSIYLAFQ